VVAFAAEQVGALAIAVQAATTLDSAAAARPAIGAASVVAIAAVVAAIAPDFAVAVAAITPDFAAAVVGTAEVMAAGTVEAMAEVTVGAIADHDRQALILLRRVAKQSSSLPFFRVVFYRGRTTLG
jgi:hypothetical protein